MKRIILPFAILALLVTPIQAAGQTDSDEDEGATVDLEIGGWATDTTGSQDVVSEYEPDEGGPQVGLEIEADTDWGFLLFDGTVRNEDDQKALLDFDVRRMVRSHTEYLKLPHRLLHDDLSNLAAVTSHGRILQHTDLDPGTDYRIRYSDLDHRTEIQLPSAERFTLAFNVRNQERKGVRQHLTVSHCASCHVYSQDRPIDQRDTGVGLEGRYNWDRAALRVSYEVRELEQDPAFLTLLFDDALQPELLLPLFDNRLQWDSAQGPQRVDLTPDIDKQVAKIDLTFPKVAANGVWSVTENQFTGLESDFTGVTVSAGHTFRNANSLRWRGRAYTIDNDDVFVDIAEPVGIAGPHTGITYREAYGFDPDFLRLSSLNRDVFESRFDYTWKLGSREAGRLKLLWELEQVDREHFAVTEDGDTDTLTNILGVSWRGRPARGWKLEARVRHGEVDNPFTNVNGVFSTNVGPPAASPFDPNADQYFDFQDARIGDAVGSPESWDELRAGFSRTRGNSMVTAYYNYWDGENDSGDLTDWSRDYQSATVTWYSTPAPDWEWFATYAYHDSTLEAPASIPLFDG